MNHGLIHSANKLQVKGSFGKTLSPKLLPLALPSVLECVYERLLLPMSRWRLTRWPLQPVYESVVGGGGEC